MVYMSLLQDTGFILIAIIVFMIAAVSAGLILNTFNNSISTAPNIATEAKTNINNLDTQWGGAMDWILLGLLIGMPLISLGLAHFNNIPSIFFYITIALLLLFTFIGWGIQAM